MNRMIRTISALAACASAAFVTAGCMPYSTGPTEVGIRTIKFSLTGNKGVQDKVYPPGGTYFFVPFINDWDTFDTRLQNLEMTAVETRGDRPSKDDLIFKTIDGNGVFPPLLVGLAQRLQFNREVACSTHRGNASGRPPSTGNTAPVVGVRMLAKKATASPTWRGVTACFSNERSR